MKYRIGDRAGGTPLADLPHVHLELDAEEFTLIAAVLYHRLSGISPVRDRVRELFSVFKELTGLSTDALYSPEPHVLDHVNQLLINRR